MAHLSRRSFLHYFSAAGLGIALPPILPSAFAAAADSPSAHPERNKAANRSRAEWITHKDQQTGVEVVQLTNYKGHSHHFYFTNSGWYDGGRKLLFSSERNNRTNLYGIDLANGEIEQVTDLAPAPHGVDFLTACKNPVREEVYFWHNLGLMAVDLKTKQTRRLRQFDPGWGLSMSSCAADGKHVYLGITEELNIHGFKEVFEAHPLCKIFQVSCDTGEQKVIFQKKQLIAHINASPTQRNLLTFCHEGPWNLVGQRIWGLDADTGKVWKIRPPLTGKDIVGHEYWYADGVRIGYHGLDVQGRPMLGRIKYDGTDRHEASFPGMTGHIFSLDERLVVGDGNGVIRIWRYDGKDYVPPRVLCRHDSNMDIQQAHPHPRISPDGKYVVFTSDRSGYCNVYKVAIADFERLPLAE